LRVVEDRRRNKGLAWLLAVVLIGAAMLWPAVLNGRPSYFPDSIGYFNNGRSAVIALLAKARHLAPEPAPAARGGQAPEQQVQRPDQVVSTRAVAYSVFAYLTGWPGGRMFLTVLAQGLMVATLLLMWWRRLAPDLRWSTAVAAGCAMAAGTSASWFVSFAMPDIFAGAALMALLILSFPGARRIGMVAGTFLVLIVTVGFAVHVSHIPLLMVATVSAIALHLLSALRRQVAPDWRTLGWLAAPIGLGLVGILAISLVGFSEISLAPKRMPAVLARSIEDGPARWYLEQHCATERYVICQVFPVIPKYQTEVLFGPDGLGRRATPAQMDAIREEEPTIVLRALAAYPWVQARRSGEAFLLQLSRFGVFDLSFRGEVGRAAADEIRLNSAPSEPLFPRGAFDGLIYGGVAVAALYLLWTRGRPRQGEAAVLAVAIVGLIANAAVTGILSAVADRYQARVIWVVPALAIGFYLARRPEAPAARVDEHL
jgi:hypothetical protein